jgi:hypothetical protein
VTVFLVRFDALRHTSREAPAGKALRRMSIRSFATTDNEEGKMSAMLYELTASAA